MKQLLEQYAAYSLWANEQLMNTIRQLPPSKHQEETPSSFPTLHKTVLHMWDAESIWWQRLEGTASLTIPSKVFTGEIDALADGLLGQNRQWLSRVKAMSEAAVQQPIRYKNLKGVDFEDPMYVILNHVFNHGTYHRGQLVTMLRALGVVEIPQTDFIYWHRVVAV